MKILKVFIAGPRNVNELDKNILIKLENICNKNYDVLIGDAIGMDSYVQQFLHSKLYKNVTVFASNGIVRNNYGFWNVENVPVEHNVTGFDFYARKDLEMAKKADIGFMIWNGKSRGTFNNMVNLLGLKKEIILYYLPNQMFYHFKEIMDLKEFLKNNVELNNNLRKILDKSEKNQFMQVCLF